MGNPPLNETPEKLFPLQERLRTIKEGYGNVERVFRDYETSGNPGELKDAHLSLEQKPMLVRTDSGAIVKENREILTERLSGCIGLFVRGPGLSYLVHMTPNSYLGFYYHRYPESDQLVKAAVEKIFAKLPADIAREVSVFLITNIPDETDGTYGRRKLTAAWQRLEEQIRRLGVSDVKTIELPLDETLLFFSPFTPKTMYAMGNRVEIGPDGNYIFHHGEVEEKTVSLTP